MTSLRLLAEMGAGAVVLPSLFEEELATDGDASAESYWSAEDHAGAAAAYMGPSTAITSTPISTSSGTRAASSTSR
jgi:hypothetical protein